MGRQRFYYLERREEGDTAGAGTSQSMPGLVTLPEGTFRIGRNPDSDLVFPPDERSVSGEQASIVRTNDVLQLMDSTSRNGTFVNGERVTEAPLRAGDEIRFGRNGPRLRVICSQVALVQEAAASAPRAQEVQLPLPEVQLPNAGPGTLFYEYKLNEGTLEARELHKLIRDEDRVKRIVARGEVGKAQASLLHTSAQASRASRRRFFLVILLVFLVGASTSTYFAYQSWRYQQVLAQGLSLEDALDRIETEIAKENTAPEQNQARLKELMKQLESTRGQLDTVKVTLETKDVEKLYADPLEEKIDRLLKRFGEESYHIPPTMTARIRHHLGIFSGQMRRTVGQWLKRRDLYFPIIEKVLKAHNLPVELGYISMNESGLDPEITSVVGARGLWQLMPGTARQYGLRVDDSVDERILPEKSTDAAARYLQDLISIFGARRDVMLVMASYNAGEGRLMRALKRIDDPMANRDFWYLYRMGLLAEETNEYVPKVLALMLISEDPAAFGFEGKASRLTGNTNGSRENSKDAIESGKKQPENDPSLDAQSSQKKALENPSEQKLQAL